MAKRYKKSENISGNKKQLLLTLSAVVLVAVIIAGLIVKAKQGAFKNVFNNTKYTVTSAVSSVNSFVTSVEPSDEAFSSDFSSDTAEVFAPSSIPNSSNQSGTKPSATPTPKPTTKPTPTPTPKPTPTPTPSPTPAPTPEVLENLTIMGTYNQTLTAAKMAAFVNKNRSGSWLLSCSAEQLAGYYLTEGQVEGVRGDIAFCQAIIETGWFSFPNPNDGRDPSYIVTASMNNFCGLGATGDQVPEILSTPQMGVRAHIQHLKAYGSTLPLINPQVDDRFSYVYPRGKALKWANLSGTWASDPTYGTKILNKYSDLLK